MDSMKYQYNNSGRNYIVFTDGGVEIGYFYPADDFDMDDLGWVDIDLKTSAQSEHEITDNR
jgi:hypothetical protein